MKHKRVLFGALAVLAVLLTGGLNSAQAVGSAQGYLKQFKTSDSGTISDKRLLVVAFNRYEPFTNLAGSEVSPSFLGSFDTNGLCQYYNSASTSYGEYPTVALEISDLNDPMKKTQYTMLMSAALLNKPIYVELGQCLKDNLGSAHWEIRNVRFP